MYYGSRCCFHPQNFLGGGKPTICVSTLKKFLRVERKVMYHALKNSSLCDPCLWLRACTATPAGKVYKEHASRVLPLSTRKMGFRCCAKSHFVTYPQCQLPMATITTHWQVNWLVKPYHYVIIARELHEDGNPHYHVVVQWKHRLDVQREAYFDIDGYHPNIQATKNLEEAITYAKKGGDFWEDGTVVLGSERKRKRADDQDDVYRQAMNECQDKISFLKAIEEGAPRDYVLNYDRILAMAEARFATEDTIVPYVPAHTRQSFTKVPEELDDWIRCNLDCPQPERPRCLVLVGPSRLGKTEWARSLGRHMYFNGMFMQDLWDTRAQYAVFDDIDWKWIVNGKGWLGGQKEFVITDKYRKKMRVHWNHPVIWCTNKPLIQHEGLDLNWLEANATIIHLNQRLY